jgi:hypothetical protein
MTAWLNAVRQTIIRKNPKTTISRIGRRSDRKGVPNKGRLRAGAQNLPSP